MNESGPTGLTTRRLYSDTPEGNTKMTTLRYWIALNGASCAMSSMPMRRPEVSPRPWQLIGLPTFEEAREAQRICLN